MMKQQNASDIAKIRPTDEALMLGGDNRQLYRGFYLGNRSVYVIGFPPG
jgi:hypothetical protein